MLKSMILLFLLILMNIMFSCQTAIIQPENAENAINQSNEATENQSDEMPATVVQQLMNIEAAAATEPINQNTAEEGDEDYVTAAADSDSDSAVDMSSLPHTANTIVAPLTKLAHVTYDSVPLTHTPNDHMPLFQRVSHVEFQHP